MYLTYFGLSEPPFSITPDPRFVYLSSRHEDALAHLIYGIEHQVSGGGFVQLTGEVGTGKTTLCRLLLERLPAETKVALVLNPLLEPVELLEAICEELKISVRGARGSAKKLVDRLNRYLLDANAAGETVVLIIDEAQNLSPLALEQIRLLTNLETSTRKLLQIILLGQPELRQLLARADLRQLAQRITTRFHLTALSRDEARDYVGHRLAVAGATRNPFTDAAVRRLHRLSGGVPRLVNIIAERALLAAYSRETATIERRHVDSAAREVRGEVPTQFAATPIVATAATALMLALAYFAYTGRPPSQASAPVDQQFIETQSDVATPPTAPQTAAPVPANDSVTPERPDSLSLAQAWNELLERRGLEGTELPLGGCAWRVNATLRCLPQRGSIDDLIALGRPALTVMAHGYGVAGPAVGGNLLWSGEAGEISLGIFADHWSGEFWDVFEIPGYVDTTLGEGDRGPAVLWVKSRARRADPSYQGDPNDPYFGPSLRRWTERFQSARNLNPDGLIGPATLQQLSRTDDHVDHT